MGMNNSRIAFMAVAAIFLAALTSTEVEACLGEPCNIGNPTMCHLIRETNRAGSMPSRRRLKVPKQKSSTRRVTYRPVKSNRPPRRPYRGGSQALQTGGQDVEKS